MSDSQPPSPQPPSFEVPDLELDPSPPPRRQSATVSGDAGALSQQVGPLESNESLDDFEFERSARPDFRTATEHRAAKSAQLEVDGGSVESLADYGEPPDNGARALVYAYRVFTRRRELKRQLGAIGGESTRAEKERQDTLLELARALRPALEQEPQFHLVFAAVDEIEQRAALVELSRALLASPDTFAIPDTWLGRVRSVSERADRLLARREMLTRALGCYDARRARQGVNLACTGVGLLLVLFAFKLIF
ncbi:MAG TPA: hypothetical protein VER12_12185 [Polyangiaceae bacterium]|nr:hypothetical protein [Polyangiaceae bacterium]